MLERLLTMVVWRDGRAQLEARIRVIDGVLNLGFEIRCLYSVRLYVPTVIDPNSKEKDYGRNLIVRRAVGGCVEAGVQTTLCDEDMENILTSINPINTLYL